MTDDVRAYVDAKSEATRAQNDARFAEVMSEIKTTNVTLQAQLEVLGERIAAIPRGTTLPQLIATVASAAVAGIAIVMAVIAWGGAEFTAAFQSSPAFDQRIKDVTDAQAQDDAKRDAVTQEILKKLDQLIAGQPQKP